MTPAIISLALSSMDGHPTNFVHTITDLLSEAECQEIISRHQDFVPSNVTTNTVRDREIFDDETLAALIWERLEQFYVGERVIDDDGQAWAVKGLNERFRLCRYEKGGKFSPHCDGRRFASVNEQSFMTVNIYLNTVSIESGGATRFLSLSRPGQESKVITKVQPVLGSASVFRDYLWHDGEEVTDGVKLLLRTDVMYSREKDFNFEAIYGGLNDESKGEKALRIGEALEDAGNSNEAVRWYKRAFKLSPSLER